MTINQTNSSTKPDIPDSFPTDKSTGFRWWLHVAQVRLRFLLIIVLAGGIVSQWTTLRSLQDRWTWSRRTPTSGSVSPSQEYFCPMDPGVLSVWPAICPICNMDLVPRKKMESQMLPSGVVARMQLSPYRIQLAGIRTETIESRPLKYEQTLTGVLQRFEDGSVGFEASLSEGDLPLFSMASTAELRQHSKTEFTSASVRVIDDSGHSRARFVLDDPNSVAKGSIVTAKVLIPYGDDENVLCVPESAVVDRGLERLVYVESMPGIFDGVQVELGQRCGAVYPILSGLKAGQKVASAGAFLIDAESRLNPSLAAGYFGANQSESRNASPSPVGKLSQKPLPAKSGSLKQGISREDQALIDKQRICPVTELPLDSMGGPISVQVSGRKVFICCAGCEQRLKAEPDKYLTRLKHE
jgi:Cu(I)/Ag(I) efflux system membrane fusion protein